MKLLKFLLFLCVSIGIYAQELDEFELSDALFQLIANNPQVTFVYVPEPIQQLLLSRLSIVDTTLYETAYEWLEVKKGDVLPALFVEEIIGRILDNDPQTLHENVELKQYIESLNNGDAALIIEDEDATRGSKPKILCNLLVRNNAQICGNLCVKGKIFGTIVPGTQGPPGPQGPQGPPGPEEYGNVVRVDQVFGDDATGERNGAPFLTINAALAVAQPGDVVWIFPGTYPESFTIPDGVIVAGIEANSVNITQTVAVSTDAVTMGENTTLENVNIVLNATTHVQLRGVVFPGTTTETANIRAVNIEINNSSAPIGGSSDVYGIHSSGSGSPLPNTIAVRESSVIVRSVGGGSKRALFVDSSSRINAMDTTFLVTSSGGVGSFIGVVTDAPGAVASLLGGTSEGSTADIAQIQGVLIVNATQLVNSNAAGIGFSVGVQPANMVWGDAGGVPAGDSFLRPGVDAANANEIFVTIPQDLVLKSLTAAARVAPGVGNTINFIVRRNGIDTTLTVSLSGTSVSATNNSNSVTFTAGDLVSVRMNRPGGSSAQDVQILFDMY